MRISNRMSCIILFLIFIVGCEREVNVLPEKVSEESTAPLALATAAPSSKSSEMPAHEEFTAQAVRISLEPRGFLKAPIKTVVADTPQTFTIEFPEGMNRKSVEETLRNSILIRGAAPPPIDLQFNWSHEKELHLIVKAEGIENNLYPTDGYIVDVNGALTSSGKVLKDAPTFRTLIQKPKQLWRISLTDGHSEMVSDFKEPFNLQSLYDANYMLATQFLDYCECDMVLPRLSSVYNIGLDQMTTYPVPLMVQYKGKGDFIADKRGFFYEQPKSGEVIHPSDAAESVHVAGYVHGASFSHDRKNLLLAVGQEKQEDDLDFVIYNLDTKRTMNMPKKLVGQVPDNQVSSTKIPIQFQDDGTYVYTYMINDENHDIQEYRYTWSSGMLESWKSPVEDNAWNGFLATEDGAYRYYYNGGMYRGNERITLPDDVYLSFWQRGANNFVYLKSIDSNPHSPKTLNSYDMDEMKIRTIAKLPPGDQFLVGSSWDGLWVYVFTGTD